MIKVALNFMLLSNFWKIQLKKGDKNKASHHF